ncbi:MAG: hypothetical protein IKI28_08700, partial [Bacteroidales bacterium]|nr:hypothetical protein [Bacteroidales bacterium]
MCFIVIAFGLENCLMTKVAITPTKSKHCLVLVCVVFCAKLLIIIYLFFGASLLLVMQNHYF